MIFNTQIDSWPKKSIPKTHVSLLHYYIKLLIFRSGYYTRKNPDESVSRFRFCPNFQLYHSGCVEIKLVCCLFCHELFCKKSEPGQQKFSCSQPNQTSKQEETFATEVEIENEHQARSFDGIYRETTVTS